jgi:hypothetical protein
MRNKMLTLWTVLTAAALIIAPFVTLARCDMEGINRISGGGSAGAAGGGGKSPLTPNPAAPGTDTPLPGVPYPGDPEPVDPDAPRPPGGMSDAERDIYEQTGHFLKLYHLPSGASGDRVSAVRIANAGAPIAGIDPAVSPMPVYHESAQFTTVYVPLIGPNDAAFVQTGSFLIDSLQVNFDFDLSINIRPEHQVWVNFVHGRAVLDLTELMWQKPEIVEGVLKGYFTGGLVNPADTAAPIVKNGTIFEMNGEYHHITANTPVTHADPLQTGQKTELLYIYARRHSAGTVFEYLALDPVYVAEKRGWYSGSRRALYRLVYIRDNPDKYVAKTFITDDFTHFDHVPVTSVSRSNIPAFHYFLSGSGNPPQQRITLPAGIYLLELAGSGGGGLGQSVSSAQRNGGSGGYVAEVVFLTSDVAFSLYSGQGGGPAEDVTGFNYNFSVLPGPSGGGGGGAGSFVYSENGYLLCAGGGGGSGGIRGSAPYTQLMSSVTTFYSGGAGGGAGGSLGPGGGGGAGSPLRYHYISGYEESNPQYDSGTLTGSRGGTGGGYGGGGPGINSLAAESGYTGSAYGPANQSGFGGTRGPGGTVGNPGNETVYPVGGAGGAAAYCQYDELLEAAHRWKNTNNANGRGGGGGYNTPQNADGGSGGNNRNTVRGGGSLGGAAGYKGGDGFVRIFKVY